MASVPTNSLVVACYLIIVVSSSLSSAKLASNRLSRKAYYGSPCNSTVKCDIHSLLMCEENGNVCGCLYPDAMEYNADLGTCVSLVNEICGYLETKRVFINCVPNAYCDQQQGVCKCSQGYIEGDRHCIKQKNYGEPCHSDNECLSELSLICFEELCQCDPQRHQPSFAHSNSSPGGVYLKEHGTRCVALAGLPCTAKTGCVAKASCVSETGNEAILSSSSFDWMHSGICRCDIGYEMDDGGTCRGKFGSICDVLANVSCVSELQCLDGRCSCKYPDDQVFHAESGTCVSLVNGPCTESNGISTDEDAITCNQFMECRNSVCTCTNGFVMNQNRGCHLSFGQPCTGETMNKCDSAAGLHCVDGHCRCVDRRKKFDEKIGKCVGQFGSSCKLVPTSCGTSKALEKDNERLSCSENMKCQVSRSQLKGKTSNGFCIPVKDGGESVPTRQAIADSSSKGSPNDEESDSIY